MREKTRYAISQALRILVGFPAIWLAFYVFSKIIGGNYTPSLPTLIVLMVVFGLMAISNYVVMK
jgi:hypothetical protein